MFPKVMLLAGRLVFLKQKTAEAKPTWYQNVVHRSGSSWTNGYNEAFHGNLQDELLNGVIFYRLKQAKILIDSGGALQHGTST